jgi:phosphohistidine phosphatase
VEIDAVISSPKVRAEATARIAAAHLGTDVELDDALRGGDFDLAALAAGRGEVMLVGHEPDFSRAIQLVTGARVNLKKGGLAAIEDGALLALMRPRELRRIAGL